MLLWQETSIRQFLELLLTSMLLHLLGDQNAGTYYENDFDS